MLLRLAEIHLMINQLLCASCMIEIIILVGLLLSNQKLCEQQKWLVEGKYSECFGIKTTSCYPVPIPPAHLRQDLLHMKVSAVSSF